MLGFVVHGYFYLFHVKQVKICQHISIKLIYFNCLYCCLVFLFKNTAEDHGRKPGGESGGSEAAKVVMIGHGN